MIAMVIVYCEQLKMHTAIKQEAINNYYIAKLSGDSDSECYAFNFTIITCYSFMLKVLCEL